MCEPCSGCQIVRTERGTLRAASITVPQEETVDITGLVLGMLAVGEIFKLDQSPIHGASFGEGP